MPSWQPVVRGMVLVMLAAGAPGADERGAPTAAREPGPIEITPEALRLHQSALLIDGHNDLPWRVRVRAAGDFERLDIAKLQTDIQTDIPRLRRGGVDGQFWVVYVPPETARTGTAKKMALEQFDLIDRMIARYDDTFALARTADDIERISRSGKIAGLIGIEGGHMIENSLATLREFYDRGARYLGLTHSESIDWADACSDEARSGGLSAFGVEVIRELNRLGMLVDIAHVSHDTMRDVLRVSRAPIISSHSGAYAVAQHGRNVPDDVLRGIKDNGGVVMLVFFSGYIHPAGAIAMADYFEVRRALRDKHPEREAFQAAWTAWKAEHPVPAGTVRTLVDHVDHIVQIAGVDHVGLGGDYEGASKFPLQLEDVSGYPAITQELLNRGYSETDIRKILGGNLLRALRAAERIAAEMQAE